MENHQEAVEALSHALKSFIEAGGTGNSAELASKLEELHLLVKEKDTSLAQMIPLEPLVAALDVYGWNPDVCKACYGLLKLIIQTSEFPALMEKYEPALAAAARNPERDLVVVSVEALKLGLADEYIPLLVQSDFFPTIVKRIASPDGELSEMIFNLLKESKVYSMFPSQMEEWLREAAEEQQSDHAMIAVLDVLCTLRKTVPQSSSLYLGLDEYLKCSDLLLQLCAIQIIIQNADRQHDFDLLSTEGGIIEYLVSRLPHDGSFVHNEEPIYSKAFTLFSNLMCVASTNWDRFTEKLLPAIKVCLAEPSEAQKDAILLVGCMTANRSMQAHFEELKEAYFKFFTSSSLSIQSACLFSTSVAVANAISEEVKALIVQRGLGSMGPKSPFENLQAHCCSAIDEVKEAAYACLSQLLIQRSFTEEALQSSSLFLFLTNRLDDSSATGLNSKYSIIEKLMKQDWAPQVFNEPMRGTFQKYLSQGVFYNEASPQLAMH